LLLGGRSSWRRAGCQTVAPRLPDDCLFHVGLERGDADVTVVGLEVVEVVVGYGNHLRLVVYLCCSTAWILLLHTCFCTCTLHIYTPVRYPSCFLLYVSGPSSPLSHTSQIVLPYSYWYTLHIDAMSVGVVAHVPDSTSWISFVSVMRVEVERWPSMASSGCVVEFETMRSVFSQRVPYARHSEPA
jgi:hypothetical protein